MFFRLNDKRKNYVESFSQRHARSQQLGRIVVPRTQEHRMPTNLWRLALFRKMELGALWGYRAVSVFFLRSRRGPLLCFMFEGPRERDFPYSNRSVRCAPRRALCRARQRATFRGALLSGATDFSKAATPRARGPAGVLGCPTECRQETASPALRGGVALLEERATTARTPPGVLWQPPRQIAREL